MWSGTLTLGVDSVTVMRGSLHGRGREFALVSWLLRNVTDHRVNQVALSHLPKGRFSYPRRAFSAFVSAREASASAGKRASSFCVRRAPKADPLHGHKGRIMGHFRSSD